MSFDLELMAMRNGEPDNFPTSIVRAALEGFVTERNEDFWTLSFPDGGGGEMLAEDDDSEETSGVSIQGASGGDIYDALYDILRQTHSVLTWSFGGCAVADPGIIADLPEEMLEELGEPIVVRSGADILAAVQDG